MSKTFQIRSGGLRVTKEAHIFEDAIREAIAEAPDGLALGKIIQIKEEGNTEPYYILTERFIDAKKGWPRTRHGSEPPVLKIEMPFEDAIKKSFQKARPAGGWPKFGSKK